MKKDRGGLLHSGGHLTPLCLTDDKTEFKSNIDLRKVSSNFRILSRHPSVSPQSTMRFQSRKCYPVGNSNIVVRQEYITIVIIIV